MMATKRDAILNGIGRAAELHAELGLREKLKTGERPINVLGALQFFGIATLFRPLEGLLGAYVPTPRSAGVLITTLRDHHVQRFTAAHELGHHVLEHKTLSLDKKVGFVARGEKDGYDYQEQEADAFAAEFLLPKWLLAAHARRQGWTARDLKRADVVYQLSLRVGASFSATCWALAGANFLTRSEATALAELPPKASKQRALGDVTPDSWWPDVWVLSERDRGAQLLGSPEDYLVFNLQEHDAGGYEWDLESMPAVGLSIRKDERRETTGDTSSYGATVRRHVIAQGQRLALERLKLEERRPWELTSKALNTFEVDLALLGKEPVGLPRRERLLAA
jgi:hypothetical protein